MPILLPAGSDEPLDQGDVLVDVVTVVADGTETLANRPGPVMVISRGCNAIRDANVVVAPIVKCDLAELEGIETLRDFVDFFKALRDGDGRPDTFYLGEMAAGSTERYVAKFDRLYTIGLPHEPELRKQFLSEHRRFKLAVDFQRDLHQRLFRAFASMGFDDEAWWSDEDLKFLVAKGKALHRQQEAEVEAAKDELATLQMAAGEQKGQNKTNTMVKQAEKAAAKTAELLAPFVAEHGRRFASIVGALSLTARPEGESSS